MKILKQDYKISPIPDPREALLVSIFFQGFTVIYTISGVDYMAKVLGIGFSALFYLIGILEIKEVSKE